MPKKKSPKAKSKSSPKFSTSLGPTLTQSNGCIQQEAEYVAADMQYQQALAGEQAMFQAYLAAKQVAEDALAVRTAKWQAWQDCLNS